MGFTSLENQYISASFGQLVQISGSALGDGNGAELSGSILDITSSRAVVANTAETTISASHALSADSVISASYAATASVLLGGVQSASYAETATSASHALQADYAEQADDLVITVRNTHAFQIPKGTAVHSIGVLGENVTVVTASADDPNLMPAIGVTSDNINAGSNGEVIIQGRLIGFSTTGLSAGDPVYVNNGGLLTATKPTGSSLIQNIGVAAKIDGTDGELIIQGAGRSNDVPNITDGMLWLGNSSGVATPTSASSLSVANAVSASYAVSATLALSASHANQADRAISASNADSLKEGIDVVLQSGSFDVLTAASASFGYIESITGSAKIIGDAFIILNNDTPTERYAGLKVIDSGSSGATASIQFDGQTNDWFYEYTASGDPLNHGVVLFGPEYGTIGSPIYPTANEIQMGDGGHHLTGSKLYSDLSKIYSDLPFSASAGFTGSLNGQADTAISASHALNADNAITASYALNAGGGAQLVSGSGFNSVRNVIAGGASSTAGGFAALSLGNSAIADNVESVALGSSATVRSNYGVGIGRLPECEIGDSPIAIGNAALSYGNSSIAIGKSAAARSGSSYSIVMGEGAQTDKESSIMIGFGASGSGANQIRIGSGSIDNGANTTTIGNPATTDAYLYGVAHIDGARISGSISNEVQVIAIATGTASLDLANYNTFHIDMGALAIGTYRIEASSSPVAGAVYNIQIDNGSAASCVLSGVDAEFKFPGGTLPTLAEGANAINIMSGLSIDGTSVMMTALADFQ